MSIRKKVLNFFLAISFLIVIIPIFNVSAQNIETQEITVYENTFDDGVSGVVSVSNEFLSYDGTLAQNIRNSEINGNMGIRVRREAWMSSQTFLLDFTKGGAQHGIYSGVISASFDFSLDEESTADYIIIGANMSKTYEGGRMIYFSDTKYQVLEKRGDWGSAAANGVELDTSKVYNMKIVMNLDEGKAEYFLDNELIKTQTNWSGVTVNNFSISLSGLMDYFDNFKVTVKYPNAVENEVMSENIGNIFYDDEQMLFSLKVKNRHDEKLTEDIRVKITDAYGKTIWDEAKTVEVEAKASSTAYITPDIPKFGTYFMTVTSDNSEEFKTRLSRSVKAPALNEKSGVCAHFDGRHPMDVPGMFDIMANAGFGTVRTDWGWRLDSDGTAFDYDDNGGIFEETIKEANERGIDILAILGVSNSNYGDLNADGGLNTEPEALAAYKEFCAAVAADLKGKVDRFEIGNENNYDKRYATSDDIGVNTIVLSNGRTLIDENYVFSYPVSGDYNTFNKTAIEQCTISIEKISDDSGIYAVLNVSAGDIVLHENTKAYVFETGENYAKLLKAAYEGVKAGNAGATVLTSGSGLGYKDPDWSANRNMQEFAHGLLGQMQSENYYYFDVYATHPYHSAQPPELVDRWIMSQDWSMQAQVGNEMFEAYSVPEDKVLWATEFGYSARDDENDSEKAMQRAAWIVRTMLLNEIGGYHDKMYLYDILNDGLKADNAEHNFGTICYCNNESWNNVSAYAAKPQYLAMAQYNKMLAGAEFEECIKEDKSSTEKTYNTKFKRGDDYIYVLWDTYNSGETVTVTDTADVVTVYDYFGNVLQRCENPDSVSVTLGETPVYVEFDVISETYIEVGDNISVVYIVNKGNEPIAPYVFNIAEDFSGRILNVDMQNEYYVNDTGVDKIMPGEYAKVQCYTPENSNNSYKLIVVDSLEKLTPLCEAKIK